MSQDSWRLCKRSSSNIWKLSKSFLRGHLQTRIKDFSVQRECKILLEDSQFKEAGRIKEVINSMSIMQNNVFQKIRGTTKALANL